MQSDSIVSLPRAGDPQAGHAASEKRISRIAGDGPLSALIHRLVDVSLAGLPAMYDREADQYVHSIHRIEGAAPRRVGHSPRYGAIVALGARWLPEPSQMELFGGLSAAAFMRDALRRSEALGNLGDLALVTWAAAATGCGAEVRPALERLARQAAAMDTPATVELAWCLSAFVAAREIADTAEDARNAARRLLSVFAPQSGIFPPAVGTPSRGLRSHVGCFADQVYPIQALSRYHAGFGDAVALEAAARCADQVCRLQGPHGQWWWHYDARTGSVVEGYPVYSVHQDAMGPMALLDLHEAGGPDHALEIRRSLEWMQVAAEVGHSLVDDTAAVIWRKVGRAEPRKLTRGVRAVATRFAPDLRLPFLDTLFPPVRIDWECRPYHLGWILDTWLGAL